MMEYNQFAKQAIDFQKNAFNSWYNAVTMVQDQAAAAVETMMNQTSLVPEDGRQAIKSWVSACQKERNRFKSYVDDSFFGLEKRLSPKGKSAPAESKRTVAKAKN
jgi:phage-related protein